MAKNQNTAVADPFESMVELTVEDAKIPRKGRQLSDTTTRIIESLNSAKANGTVKAIPCADLDTFKDLERKIRSAAKQIPMKVTIRRNAEAGTLVFGPEEVFKGTKAAA